METFKTTLEIEVEITYETDQEIRQGSDTRFPNPPYVDEVNYGILTNLDEVVKKEAEEHFSGRE